MNFDRAVQVMERMQIRDKGANLVNLKLNFCQKVLIEKIKQQQASGQPTRIIILKARRLGISTFSEALMTVHALAVPNARGMVVAQDMQTSKELFEMGKRMRDSFPIRLPPGTQRVISIPHGKQMSTIRVATAATVSGGRGLALSALHCSEVAMWRSGVEAFMSLLSTVPNRDKTMIVIESTAKGKIGPGSVFYEFWNAAVEGRNDYLPVFLPWTMDPECEMPEERMEDTELDEEEKMLVDKGCTMRQLAWRRWTIENICHGILDKFHEEYPTNPHEAFISSGNPAFNTMMLRWARKAILDPLVVSMPRRSGYQIVFEEDQDGIAIWEKPDPNGRYYIGADVAKGESGGDFSAFCVWNGQTGEQVARYAARVGPERLADLLDMVGRSYNNAMVNIEVTGGWGAWCQKVLRDHYTYPNFYRWKGRDDHVPGRGVKQTYGWETNYISRKRMFAAFREGLAGQRIVVHDVATLNQLESAVYDDGFTETIEESHDDITFAALIGWIAVEDYPPPRTGNSQSRILSSFTDDTDRPSDIRYGPVEYDGEDARASLSTFVSGMIERNIRKTLRPQVPDRLEGLR